MEFSWQISDNHEQTKIEEFAKTLNSSHILARVLLNRGIEDVDTARHFFLANLKQLHDPFLMAGMHAAVARVQLALQRKEKILVYGDYDVDGTTATSMLMLFFRYLQHPIDFYIPDRVEEGYGLSEKGMREAHARGASLIITVDCGINAVREIELARRLGIDVIVCDHHEPGPELPQATAILNPKQSDCQYPFKELAGVGVAFKLTQALQLQLQLPQECLYPLLALVAIGSSADIVPLVDENRTLVKIGLDSIASSNNTGLQALLEATGLKNKTIGVGQVVFVLAPRINAVGRMGNAGRAVDLLTCTDKEHAQSIASVLESENRIRKNIDEETLAHALELIAKEFDPDNERILVLNNEGWHPGVIGIVASRIVDRYFRPTIMISSENGVGKGSARSIPGFDIYLALNECRDLMNEFGGHKYAAGLTIETDKIPELRRKLAEVAAQNISDEMLIPKLRIDAEVRFNELTADLIKLLNRMAPFGPQNMRPVFVCRGVEIVGTPRIVGKNHLKFKARQDGVVMDAIGYDLGDLLYRISAGEKDVDLVFVVDENEWQGRKFLQLRVKDLR